MSARGTCAMSPSTFNFPLYSNVRVFIISFPEVVDRFGP